MTIEVLTDEGLLEALDFRANCDNYVHDKSHPDYIGKPGPIQWRVVFRALCNAAGPGTMHTYEAVMCQRCLDLYTAGTQNHCEGCGRRTVRPVTFSVYPF